MPVHEIRNTKPVSRWLVNPDRQKEDCDKSERCILTNTVRPIGSLIRFAVGPGDWVVPDVHGTLPGQGMWLSADRNSVMTACFQKVFHRVSGRDVNIADDLVSLVELGLVRYSMDLIGIARRGGKALCGFERVRGWLKGGDVGCLITAADSASNSREKLLFMTDRVPVVNTLTAEEIGLAFGRDRAMYAVIGIGGLARKFVINVRKLEGFRGPGKEQLKWGRINNEVTDE